MFSIGFSSLGVLFLFSLSTFFVHNFTTGVGARVWGTLVSFFSLYSIKKQISTNQNCMPFSWSFVVKVTKIKRNVTKMPLTLEVRLFVNTFSLHFSSMNFKFIFQNFNDKNLSNIIQVPIENYKIIYKCFFRCSYPYLTIRLLRGSIGPRGLCTSGPVYFAN